MPKEASFKDQEQAMRLLLKLDRGRRRWRFYSLILLLFLAVGWLFNSVNTTDLMPQKHVARVDFTGLLMSDRYALEQLDNLATNGQVQAVVVYVDSPGGTMVGGLQYYQALRTIAANKPVVAIMGTTAASAGYMVSLGADHIVASPATLTGSIGVLMPLLDASELADKIGVKSDEITSGELKAITSPLTPRDEKDRAYLQEMVDELQETFLKVVTERRTITQEVVNRVRDGRALVGSQAFRLGLVDALGDVKTAREWLAKNHQISQDIQLVDYSLVEPHRWLSELVGEARTATKLLSSKTGPGVWAIQN